jgi:hypothetical protein
LFVLGLSSCASQLTITTDPSLFPAFRTSVSDYVSRCDDSAPVEVAVSAPEGVTVSVDGQEPRSGSFTTQVTRGVGQRFLIRVDAAADTTHHVRCLPADFPAWSFERTGTPQAQWYLAAVNDSVGGTTSNYTALFDTNGVPVWWLPRRQTRFATVLPNKNIAWTRFTPSLQPIPPGVDLTEVALDGRVVRELSAVGASADFHDALQLPNGNYALVTYEYKTGVDTRPLGGPEDGAVINHVIQELTPTGQLVWSWDTAAHIPVTETQPIWQSFRDSAGHYDAYHWNSIEWDGDGFVLSYRHLNAIYKVDRATGAIVWKVGGSTRPESLTVVGDPVFVGGGFSGQHDARIPAPDVLTLFDNGTGVGRPPRAVAYRLDEDLGTATLLEDVRDAAATSANCCGSTRTLPGGNFVTGWGASTLVTEHRPDGSRVVRIDMPGNVYRALPVPPGVYSPGELRFAMDTQYPK